jgi:hypothetical protein
MLRPTLFSYRKLKGAHRIARYKVVPAGTLRSPTAGIGTELLAHREKIELTRSASPFERSPVPMGLAHRHYTRAVCALPWRMPQT